MSSVAMSAMSPIRALEPHENTFETVMVDVTHRCNMHCANCYLPDRTVPDMDIGRLEECISQFPKRTNIRIAGAEPTMRRDLPQIISMVRRCGHRAVLLTNGLRLARKDYVAELHDAGLRHVYISLNGADNDDWYEHIDNLRCAHKKLRAVENVINKRMILNTGTILVRGVNECAVQRILDIVKGHGPRHALLRFKNIGALGRFDGIAAKRNLSLSDMEGLAASVIGGTLEQVRAYDRFKGTREHNSRLFPVDLRSPPGTGIWMKLTNWRAEADAVPDAGSARRGRITSAFNILPFFEDVNNS
jgi:molybdenum cofactor biosynthesis enzyme MoaA